MRISKTLHASISEAHLDTQNLMFLLRGCLAEQCDKICAIPTGHVRRMLDRAEAATERLCQVLKLGQTVEGKKVK